MLLLYFQTVPTLVRGAINISSFLLSLWYILIIFLKHFLIFWHNKILQEPLEYYLLWSQISLRSPWNFSGKWYKEPGSEHWVCSLIPRFFFFSFLFFWSSSFGQIKLENTCMYWYIHRYTLVMWSQVGLRKHHYKQS